MSAKKNVTPEQVRAYVKLLGNPYASREFEDQPAEPTLEEKRNYFRKLQNPWAHDAVFNEGNAEVKSFDRVRGISPSEERVASHHPATLTADLESELDAVLRLYKPYVARNEWTRVLEYRPSFLERARKGHNGTDHVIAALRQLQFSPLPDEKVQYNRAPAARIIRELEKLLS